MAWPSRFVRDDETRRAAQPRPARGRRSVRRSIRSVRVAACSHGYGRPPWRAEPVCDQQTAEGAGRRSRGVHRLRRATDRRPLPARKLVDGYAQQACRDSASGIVDTCGPGSPGSHPGGLGPHLTSSGFPCGLSSSFLWFPFVRRPLVSLRPASSGFPSSGVLRFVPFGRCPVPVPRPVSLRVPFPLSNLHLSAAARRFRRRWSRAAGTNVASSAATTRSDRAIRLHYR